MRLTPLSVNFGALDLLDEVGDLLKANVVGVFKATFGLSVEVEESREIRERHGPHIAACVGFVGEVRGVVYLYLKESVARYLTSQLMSLNESDPEVAVHMGNAIGVIGNLIVGPIKARLCDLGYSCNLALPGIVRGESVCVEPGRPAESLLMTISYGDECILLELLIKSFKNPHKTRITD